MAKAEAAIDYWVDRYDPCAVVRTEYSARGRHVDVKPADNGTGLCWIEARLFDHDAAALDKRLDAMARSVCQADPRTLEQRRADALGALGHGADRLAVNAGPPIARRPAVPCAVVVNVIAEQASLTDDTAARLDGADPPGPTTEQLRGMTIAEALAPLPATGPANTNPAVIMGGGMLPAPLLAAKLATTATIRPVIHPGDSPPEPRYTPSAGLARFVRCRDMTCRFPGCDEPADVCDLDHTIPYPVGPTLAANLECLCRKHHLLKTFCGWLDRQSPDGTVLWTAPGGQTYTTYPGSRLLFPSLCRPTAHVSAPAAVPTIQPNRGLMMPRRKTTREQDRANRIDAERAHNQEVRRNPENTWEEPYFPSRPPPPGEADPPPF